MDESVLPEKMKELSQSHKRNQEQEIRELQQVKEKKNHLQVQTKELLNRLATMIIETDAHLSRDESWEDSSTLVLSYNKLTHSSHPAFQVSITCHADALDIKISDGQWRQIHGVLGAWADWTDEQQVYSGPFDAAKIQKAVETAFLSWYALAMTSPDEHHVEPS